MTLSDHDANSGASNGPHDKQKRSKSGRKSDRDKDREHRHKSSSKTSSSRSKGGVEGSEVSSKKPHRKDKDREREHKRERDKDEAKAHDTRGSHSDLASSFARVLLDTQRISFPYPGFSKAHSKEAVISRENLDSRKGSISLTPEPTDADDDDQRSRSAGIPQPSSSDAKNGARPPTPPGTDVSADKKRASGQAKESSNDRSKSNLSGSSRPASRHEDRSKLSRRSTSSSQATYVKAREHKSHEKLRSSTSVRSSSSRHSLKRSSSTRSSSKRPDAQQGESSPSSARDSSPRTPTQTGRFPPPFCKANRDKVAPENVSHEPFSSSKAAASANPFAGGSPPSSFPPPPPPPPAVDIHEVPRVDYLLQNGGLPHPVPRQFLSALPAPNPGSRRLDPDLNGADAVFTPFFHLLDQYSSVLAKQGSIAVATGHQSVARRLLDRLQNVFLRDLPTHGCSCVMCDQSHEVHQGLTWGDVLERVSGRIDLPPWPPFDLAQIGTKAAEVSAEVPPRPSSPVKMDPDIAEEFREHYLRQSKKVRSAVDKWLNNTGETPAPPPQEVDDETLSFAILTNLDAEDRPFFNAVLAGTKDLKAAARAPTPIPRPRTDFVIKSGLALQRLYRLQQVPRDPECVSYLVKNLHMHHLLVTISNINNSEWEILTSGRFDGFLWSGADADDTTSGFESRSETPLGRRSSASPLPGMSRMSSRNTTPFSPYSRGTTPASFISLASSGTQGGCRQPVSYDEETEMAAIAEIEVGIYKGMESLEDAFEQLHFQAELVRTALRQRGAGLMQNLRSRRQVDVLSTGGPGNAPPPGHARPAWTAGSDGEGGSDDEWGLDEMDIMPDDSASNISSARHRRPKRRTERRTPAPIQEGDEE